MTDWQAELRNKYPPPATDGIESFYFSLDGGGRELIIDAIRRKDVRVMVEIGSFLCGSTTQWLDAAEQVIVIGIDPWEANFPAILEKYRDNPVFQPCFSKIADRQQFIDSVRTHGAAASAAANVRRFGERFVPVKAASPAVLYELAAVGVRPDLIYFDSNKVLDDLLVCRELFPEAILSGDDWTWGEDKGYPVQAAVNDFCHRYGLTVVTRRATWIISGTDK